MSYHCPKCGGHDLRIEVSVVRELQQDEDGNLQTIDIGGHEEWNETSWMLCNKCDYSQIAHMFEVPEDAPVSGSR